MPCLGMSTRKVLHLTYCHIPPQRTEKERENGMYIGFIGYSRSSYLFTTMLFRIELLGP